MVANERALQSKISFDLNHLGYEVSDVLACGNDAIIYVSNNVVDLVLIDVGIKGELDGIETGKAIQKIIDAPLIYLSAKADEYTFNRAKMTAPAGFISRPFKTVDLQRTIELAFCRLGDKCVEEKTSFPKGQDPVILNDRIFIRVRERMIKIMVADILYIEAERNYSRIFTATNGYLLSTTLKSIEVKLPCQFFARIHRSYIVNLTQIDEVGEGHVVISKKAIPLSLGYRTHFLERIQTL